jgi:hypothetical protein
MSSPPAWLTLVYQRRCWPWLLALGIELALLGLIAWGVLSPLTIQMG